MTNVSARSISATKRRHGDPPIVMVTAYDTPFARIVDDAGVDIILVGDSVADNVLGHENTLSIGMAEMIHHTGAVARAHTRALVVADLPWMSYHLDTNEAVTNAASLVRAGAGAVKLEGGARRASVITAILNAEIPVMGHLGLTPQSIKAMGGLRVQAKEVESAKQLVRDAKLLEELGCCGIVLEGVPDIVARQVTATIAIPTIGIGAGPDCDGQVLVLHDIVGLSSRPAAKFVRRYGDLGAIARDAVANFAGDVRSGSYPSEDETYHATSALQQSELGSDQASAG